MKLNLGCDLPTASNMFDSADVGIALCLDGPSYLFGSCKSSCRAGNTVLIDEQFSSCKVHIWATIVVPSRDVRSSPG